MQDIHIIRPPVQTGIDPFLVMLMTWTAVGLLGALLVFLILRRWWKKRQKTGTGPQKIEKVSAYKAAMNALAAISRSPLQDPRSFYFELTLVLRKYIGSRFNTHAAEMTSQEFVRSMSALSIDKVLKKEIVRFSTESDPIKYAGVTPDSHAVSNDIERIEKMIDQMEADVVRMEKNQEEKT